jgi:peptide/nickel transport system substrate-binding protein
MAPPWLAWRRSIGAYAAAAGLALFGCGPASPASPPPVGEGLAAALSRSADATVNIGIEGGIPSLADIAMIGTTGRPELWGIAHSALAQFDHDGNLLPLLAEQLPSVDDGTWVVNSDGTMRMTWHLRRNVKWHDGHPFTARDIRFSWEFPNDRALPLVFTRRPIHNNVTAIDTPDDHTVVMHWRVSNNYAHAMTWSDLMIYPDHVVRPLWESGDPDQILNAEQFRHGWIGLGPYRIERWNPDDSIVFKPFDDYFLGRPKIGTVVVHQIESNQAVLTRLLAGELQMTGASALDFEGAFAAQEQWAARGDGKIWWTPTSLQRLILPPSNPLFRDPRVRKALLHAIDRDEMVGELFRGSAVVGHSLLHPNEPGYRAADPVITKYAFDVARRSRSWNKRAGDEAATGC